MNWDEKSLTIALVEVAILENSKDIILNPEILQISATYRSDQTEILTKTLDSLRDRLDLISEWKFDNENFVISLTDNIPINPISEYEREKLTEKRIRRILLFKLYDIFRASKNKFSRFALASMGEILNIDKDEIYRHVSALQHDYLLEYGVCDGGQCSCHLTDYGIEICEDKSEFFETYSVVRADIQQDNEENQENNEILDEYVSCKRIEQLLSIEDSDYDMTKLIQLCSELNFAYKNRCHLSIAMILRTIINHIPPVFGFSSFQQVVSNYSGGKSFKHLMDRLDGALRKIADNHLHKPISKKEILPEFTQVDFKAEIDCLLAEIIKISHENA